MISDPDYARAFTIIRCIAWSYGYAALYHGNGTRDLDVLLVPWTEQVIEAEKLVSHIAHQLEWPIILPAPSEKPHGRLAWSLRAPGFGDPRWIDISVMPRRPKEAA